LKLVELIKNGIKIGGMHWNVEVVESDLYEGEKLGLTDYCNTHIFIRKTQSEDRMVETLLHELIHVALFHAGIDDHDESLINALSHNLLSLMRQNPELFDYIIHSSASSLFSSEKTES